MIKYYVELNENNELVAFYNSEINKEIPTQTTEISEVVWRDYFNCGFIKPKLINGKWVEDATQDEIDELTGSTLEALKERKSAELNNACNRTILGRFKATINDVEYEFSYDYESQSRFNGIGVLFFANKIQEIEWTAYQNGERVRITLNQDNFDVVTFAALQHQNSNIIKYNQLLQQVNIATTKEQVESIVWDE